MFRVDNTVAASVQMVSREARLAQLLEHQTFNLRVVGSSPTVGSLFAFSEIEPVVLKHYVRSFQLHHA